MVTQGKRNVVDYALEFYTLGAGISLNKPAFKITFRQDINQEGLSELDG